MQLMTADSHKSVSVSSPLIAFINQSAIMAEAMQTFKKKTVN